MRKNNLSPVLLLLLLLASCGKTDPASSGPQTGPSPSPPEAGPEEFSPSPFPPEALVALLRPAESPIWFEVAPSGEALPAGPRHIPSPAEAGLAPFTPWPLAPHVAATLTRGEVLYLAVNRDSLLAIVPLEGGDLGLYRFTGTTAGTVPAYWESYTVGNLFLYDDTPALFFYRDDNFSEPAAPPPDPPALALVSAALVPLSIPALAGLAEGWEADILRQGADGLWYYRELRRFDGGRELRYFRGPALSGPGEEVGVETYRGAQTPGAQAGTPEDPAGEDETLPPLPENFAYTHVTRLGNCIVAAWEEQEDYSIGAAGFMVVRRARSF